ncbi:MAG: hypothetical protein V5A62_18095 [Haloarculaceae archaeon]
MSNRAPGPDPGRGQTTHDFALGISVFLVASLFAISFVPGVTAPYTEGVSEVEQEYARAVSGTLVSNLSTGESPTTLDDAETVAFFDPPTPWGETGLQKRFALRNSTKLNVTLRGLEEDDGVLTSCGGDRCAVGPRYRDQSAATVVRLVRFDGQPYRLEVRVW